jgi:3-hydroxyisobutyrate dehydrogenase-like beta-hydroxyacid dehydrogenase
MTKPTIGFIGLGFMGHGMAANVHKAGFELTVMAHRKRAAVDDLVAQGAREAADLAALAVASDVIILCVHGADQVDDLLRRADGIAANARSGTLIVDCTTSRPDKLLALAADYPMLRFVDAPLGRSPKEAWEGRLSVMVGASEVDLAHLRPLFESFADTVQHVGSLGAGHTLKLVNNMISMGYAALFSEALTMTQKAGIASAEFYQLISSSRMDCEFFQSFIGWVRSGDARSHAFALSSAADAMAHAQEQACAMGLNLPVLSAVSEMFSAAQAAGEGDVNLPELPRVVAARHGVILFPTKDHI